MPHAFYLIWMFRKIKEFKREIKVFLKLTIRTIIAKNRNKEECIFERVLKKMIELL